MICIIEDIQIRTVEEDNAIKRFHKRSGSIHMNTEYRYEKLSVLFVSNKTERYSHCRFVDHFTCGMLCKKLEER